MAHPYYPQDAHIPHYQANITPLPSLLLTFSACIGLLLAVTCVLAKKGKPRLSSLDVFAACWFSLSGCLHVFFEGYYLLNSHVIAGQDSVLAQLWKEYTLSDSRYLTRDIFTVCVEIITVLVWGPVSLLTAVGVLTRSPSRHFFQIIICTAHLYGVALYYSTNYMEYREAGVSYSRPEFLYFWVYYVGFNLPWAVIPFGLLADSFWRMREAFVTVNNKSLQQKQR